MILLIDNYDSFVYNLARYVKELNHDYLVLRNDAVTMDEIETQIQPSHIIISPGPCTPNEAGISLPIVQKLYQQIPILGVCLGHQAIGQAFGGLVCNAQKPMHGMSSLITHNHGGLFSGLENPLPVGRYHSLIVAHENFPDSLQINATSAEGEIMALQHKTLPIYGVQFHPESILTPCGHTLIKRFLNQDVQ